MAVFGKGGKKEKKTPQTSTKQTSVKQTQARAAHPRAAAVPDVYTLMLGLAALFFLVSTIVLGLNYYWYQTTEPAVIPLSWIR